MLEGWTVFFNRLINKIIHKDAEDQGVKLLKVVSGSLLPLISKADSIFLAMNLLFSTISFTPDTPLSKFFLLYKIQLIHPSMGAMIETAHP